MNDDILSRVTRLIEDWLVEDNTIVTPTTILGDDIYMDSLDVVEFVMNLEKEFGIDIPNDDYFLCYKFPINVSNVVDYVKSKISNYEKD